MSKGTVLPTEPFTAPMPAVKPPRYAEPNVYRDHDALEAMLTARGVKFPLCGWAPGFYTGRCPTCGGVHAGDKRALQCLPCAVVQAMDAAEKANRAAFDFGKRAGRAGLFEEIRKMAEDAA